MIPNRLKRLSNLMKQTISDIIRDQMKDPRIGFVSITGVDVSPDLRFAKVFVSVLGRPEQREATIEGLNNAAGFIHKCVRAEITAKRIPELRFMPDDSIERGVRVCEAIKKAREADEAEFNAKQDESVIEGSN